MSLFTLAFAAETSLNPISSSNLMSLLPFVAIFFIFYFMLIRPQVKKQKDQIAMINSLKKGEKVIFAGGLFGSILKVEDDFFIIEIAPEIKVKALKDSINKRLEQK